MNALKLNADRLRLVAEIWLQRHGPWWVVLAGIIGVLLAVAAIVLPRLNTELVRKVATLNELQARVARSQEPSAPAADPAAASAVNYQTFKETLADDEQVLPTIKAVLDSAEKHRLISTRAEYVRARDVNAQAETLQMTVPVKGRYSDVRRWIEEILGTQAFVAVNELAFKRDEIGLNQVEAKVRLTIWHHPARPGDRAGQINSGDAGQ